MLGGRHDARPRSYTATGADTDRNRELHLVRVAILHHLEGDTEASWPAARAYADVLEQVRVAEALGYDAVWFAEHHFSDLKGRLPNPLLLVAAAATATRRIRLGPAVLLTPYYHPLRLAEDVAMTDLLTNGRLEAGLGSSGGAAEATTFGGNLDAKHERLADLIDFLSAAWRGEAVRPPGATAPVNVVPLPVQPFEEMVWVAASSHGAAAVAGRCGAHLLLPSLKTIELSAAHVATYREALTRAGHDPATRRVQVTLHAWIDADRERALAEGLPIARTYAGRYIAAGLVPRIDGEPMAETLERINFVVGDAGDLRGAVARRRQALGITQVALQLRLGGMGQERTLQAMEQCYAALSAREAEGTPADGAAGSRGSGAGRA
jgi:alkanesulfonate monooxygenase SsuD/methylene tetrahydromethanopterin reductase-like flavin-dependent oxidoreductase (luciferase family)